MDNQNLPLILGRPSVVVESCQYIQNANDCNNLAPPPREYAPLMLNMWSQTSNQSDEFSNQIKMENTTKNSTITPCVQQQLNTVQQDLQNIREELNSNKETFRTLIEILQALKKNLEPGNNRQQNCEQCQPCAQCSKAKNDVNLYENPTQIVQQPSKVFKLPNVTHLQEYESPTSSGINNISSYTSSESVQYTIIAEGNSSEEDAPIEIKLSSLENDNNLNTSDDSGRLQICLDASHNELQKEIENKEVKMLPKKRRPFENEMTYKRKKVALKSNTDSNTLNGGSDMEQRMITFGPHNTAIPARIYENINWESGSRATRQLLMALFDRHVLATHSLSGKPSPAFANIDRPTKGKLDEFVTEDIIDVVSKNSNMSAKQVRIAITTKCADENKMMKMQINKRLSADGKENF